MRLAWTSLQLVRVVQAMTAENASQAKSSLSADSSILHSNWRNVVHSRYHNTGKAVKEFISLFQE